MYTMFANEFTSELKLPKTKRLWLDQNAPLFIHQSKLLMFAQLLNSYIHVKKVEQLP